MAKTAKATTKATKVEKSTVKKSTAKKGTKVSPAAELRKKSAVELNDELVALRKEEFGLRMQRGTGQLASPARFKAIRKEVARIMTILNEQNKQPSKQEKAQDKSGAGT